MFNELVTTFGTLVGVAAFISMLVNVLKVFGIAKDGDAAVWVAGFNLVILVVMFAFNVAGITVDYALVDANLGQAAEVIGYVLSYVLMLAGSKVTYSVTRGLPFIGRSNS